MMHPACKNGALPIDNVVPDLLATLEDSSNAILVAAPGAGKTTRVPLALLTASWRHEGKILVLEPRRLAARAAARQMAAALGEKVGETVGYRVRMDTKVSAVTKIELMTEGVFTRLLLDDPELTGIAAVLFDEFHERSLEGDLGLALALEVQGALREDLRLIPMSATLETGALSALLGGCPVIKSEGRSFPVETRYLGKPPRDSVESVTAKAVQQALAEETGSVLVFLPGQKEIKRVGELLHGRLPENVLLTPLYGALDNKQQDAAIRSPVQGMRKVVLASAIAQTSLTIEGIRVVIDSGLSRVPRYEPRTGLTRLETVPVSKASADQRRGRAGRVEPGVCYRLWDEAQTAVLPATERPEILEADLSGLALDLANWGTLDLDQLGFLDPPPAAAWAEALSLLQSLSALNMRGGLTDEGKALAKLPLPPRLAHMVLKASGNNDGLTASYIAALLSEPGLRGRDPDLRVQLRRLIQDQSPRAKQARLLAERWHKLAGGKGTNVEPEQAGFYLAYAYPDRVAQARGQRGRFRLANGRGAELPQEHPLADAPFTVVADIQGKALNGRILLCAPVDRVDIEEIFATSIQERDEVKLGTDGTVRARRVRCLGQVELESRKIPDPDPTAIEKALIAEIKRCGIQRLPWTTEQLRLRARIDYLRQHGETDLPDLSDVTLADKLDVWLAPFIAGKKAVSDIGADCLGDALAIIVPYEIKQKISQLAPSHFTAPTGTRVPIEYNASTGPTIAIRVQELYGLTQHPAVCNGQLPLTLELLSPAHRPIQITRDLPGFWKGSWSDVKAEMKGRYPRHPWPDDPTQAQATNKTKQKSAK